MQASAINSGADAAPTSPQQSAGDTNSEAATKCSRVREMRNAYASARYGSPFMSQYTSVTLSPARSPASIATRTASVRPCPRQTVPVQISRFRGQHRYFVSPDRDGLEAIQCFRRPQQQRTGAFAGYETPGVVTFACAVQLVGSLSHSRRSGSMTSLHRQRHRNDEAAPGG